VGLQAYRAGRLYYTALSKAAQESRFANIVSNGLYQDEKSGTA
jgi:hypothetical protein